MPGQTGQRIGGSQGFHIGAVQSGGTGHIVHRAPGFCGLCQPGLHQPLRAFPRQALHQAQAQPNSGLMGGLMGRLRGVLCAVMQGTFQRAVPAAVQHIGRAHLHAVALGVLHQL